MLRFAPPETGLIAAGPQLVRKRPRLCVCALAAEWYNRFGFPEPSGRFGVGRRKTGFDAVHQSHTAVQPRPDVRPYMDLLHNAPLGAKRRHAAHDGFVPRAFGFPRRDGARRALRIDFRGGKTAHRRRLGCLHGRIGMPSGVASARFGCSHHVGRSGFRRSRRRLGVRAMGGVLRRTRYPLRGAFGAPDHGDRLAWENRSRFAAFGAGCPRARLHARRRLSDAVPLARFEKTHPRTLPVLQQPHDTIALARRLRRGRVQFHGGGHPIDAARPDGVDRHGRHCCQACGGGRRRLCASGVGGLRSSGGCRSAGYGTSCSYSWQPRSFSLRI